MTLFRFQVTYEVRYILYTVGKDDED